MTCALFAQDSNILGLETRRRKRRQRQPNRLHARLDQNVRRGHTFENKPLEPATTAPWFPRAAVILGSESQHGSASKARWPSLRRQTRQRRHLAAGPECLSVPEQRARQASRPLGKRGISIVVRGRKRAGESERNACRLFPSRQVSKARVQTSKG